MKRKSTSHVQGKGGNQKANLVQKAKSKKAKSWQLLFRTAGSTSIDLANGSFDSGTGQVMFGLSDILGHFGLGRVWFSSSRFRINQFLIKYACYAKTSNFVENFRSGMVSVRSDQINSGFRSTFGWAYFGCRVMYGSRSFGSSFGSLVSFARPNFKQSYLPKYIPKMDEKTPNVYF